MGVMPSGTARCAATGLEAHSFWQRIAHALEGSLPGGVGRQLLRTSHDTQRCRQLMPQGSNVPAAGKSSRIAVRRTAQTMRRQP
jgi:hypothetical protein